MPHFSIYKRHADINTMSTSFLLMLRIDSPMKYNELFDFLSFLREQFLKNLKANYDQTTCKSNYLNNINTQVRLDIMNNTGVD